MGRSRRPQRPTRPTLSRRFDLRGEADRFAGELSDLLNNTVTDGIRIRAITDRAGQQARIGYRLKPQDIGDITMIPLERLKGKPRLYLGLLFKMAPDDAGKYPMIRSSVMFCHPIGSRARSCSTMTTSGTKLTTIPKRTCRCAQPHRRGRRSQRADRWKSFISRSAAGDSGPPSRT